MPSRGSDEQHRVYDVPVGLQSRPCLAQELRHPGVNFPSFGRLAFGHIIHLASLTGFRRQDLSRSIHSLSVFTVFHHISTLEYRQRTEVEEAVEPMDVDQHVEPSRIQLLGDSDIAAIIAALKEDQPSASTQLVPPNPSFARKGYASQYEFNLSVMQSLIKINRNGMRKEDDEIVQTVLNAVKVRNETLKIADKHPGVFSFLDSKKQAEAVKSLDPFLAEFLEQGREED
ncbi:hypothetical protein COOONC_26655 [Cooperia oncophora]